MAALGSGFDQRSDDTYAEIPQNRTLFTERLTYEAALVPKVVHGLETVEQVFSHFKPTVEISFEEADGQIKKESLSFTQIPDFDAESIAARSKFIASKIYQKEQYLKIIRQLKSNHVLQTIVADSTKKKLLQQALQLMSKELDHNK